MLKYFHKSLNICCFISLASEFAIIEQTNDANDISLRTEESLDIKVGNCIDFSNAILKNERTIQGEPRVYYILRKYKKKGSYIILTDISENVKLVQLMDCLVNANHDISVVGYWLFYSNNKKALVLNRE